MCDFSACYWIDDAEGDTEASGKVANASLNAVMNLFAATARRKRRGMQYEFYSARARSLTLRRFLSSQLLLLDPPGGGSLG